MEEKLHFRWPNISLKNMNMYVLGFIVATGCIVSCEHPTGNKESGLQGRVYANAGPGFYEYPSLCTIVVSKTGAGTIMEVSTDSLGTFKIPLATGAYFLDVKESPDKYQSGPYEVTSGKFIDTRAYYYNAMIF